MIRLAGGFLHSEVERAERELGQVGDVYQRGAMLVRVASIADPSAGGIRRAGGALVIVPFERPSMRVKLTEAISFQRFDKRAEEWCRSTAPARSPTRCWHRPGNGRPSRRCSASSRRRPCGQMAACSTSPATMRIAASTSPTAG